MGQQVLTRMVCDRCGAIEDVPNDETRGWGTVSVARPNYVKVFGHERMEQRRHDYCVCPMCMQQAASIANEDNDRLAKWMDDVNGLRVEVQK